MFHQKTGFVGAVLFAAVAAVGFSPAVRASHGWIDPTTAAALYLTGVGATFMVLVGSARSSRVAAVLLVGTVGLVSALIADTLAPTAVVLTVAIGVARARLLAPKRLTRAGLVELGLGIGALAAADAVAHSSLRSMAVSVWAYWLVQSAYFLVARPEDDARRAGRDPFDVAAERATDLIDQTP